MLFVRRRRRRRRRSGRVNDGVVHSWRVYDCGQRICRPAATPKTSCKSTTAPATQRRRRPQRGCDDTSSRHVGRVVIGAGAAGLPLMGGRSSPTQNKEDRLAPPADTTHRWATRRRISNDRRALAGRHRALSARLELSACFAASAKGSRP